MRGLCGTVVSVPRVASFAGTIKLVVHWLAPRGDLRGCRSRCRWPPTDAARYMKCCCFALLPPPTTITSFAVEYECHVVHLLRWKTRMVEVHLTNVQGS
jgi:hypothetical protein